MIKIFMTDKSNPWGSRQSKGGWQPRGSNGGGGHNGGGQEPPDFSNIFNMKNNPFKGGWQGNVTGRGIGAIAVLGVVLWLLTGFYRVQPDEVGVVLRFGQYVGTTPLGLHWHIPAPIETVIRPKVTRSNRIPIGYRGTIEERRRGAVTDRPDESRMITNDGNIIEIDFDVVWRIKEADKFLFNVRNVEETIQLVAESAMRQVMSQTKIQDARTDGRARVETETQRVLQEILDDYGTGVEITQVQMQDVAVPEPVVEAFDDVLRASSDKVTLRNQAEAYRNDILPRARGEAEQMIQQAQAYRESVVARAKGEAERFTLVLNAYRDNPNVTSKRLYLETMEQILRNTKKIVMDKDAGRSVLPYLPLTPDSRAPKTTPNQPTSTETR